MLTKFFFLFIQFRSNLTFSVFFLAFFIRALFSFRGGGMIADMAEDGSGFFF